MTVVLPIQNKPNPLICYLNQRSINPKDKEIYALVRALFSQMHALHHALWKAKQMRIKPNSMRDNYLFLLQNFPEAYYALRSRRFEHLKELGNCFHYVKEVYQAVFGIEMTIFTHMKALYNELDNAKRVGIKPESMRDRYLFLQRSFPEAFYSLLSMRFKYTEELRNCFRQVGEAYQAVFGIENDCDLIEDVQSERENKDNTSSLAVDFFSGKKTTMNSKEVTQTFGFSQVKSASIPDPSFTNRPTMTTKQVQALLGPSNQKHTS